VEQWQDDKYNIDFYQFSGLMKRKMASGKKQKGARANPPPPPRSCFNLGCFGLSLFDLLHDLWADLCCNFGGWVMIDLGKEMGSKSPLSIGAMLAKM
jgi:hypothetical protein